MISVLLTATSLAGELAEMPVRRQDAEAVVLDGHVIVFGGHEDRPVKSVDVYDPAANAWSQRKKMPIGRSVFAAASLKGIIYAFGGESPQWGAVAQVHRYDADADKWIKVAPMKEARAHTAAVTLGENAWVIGGYNHHTKKALAQVEIFDGTAWKAGPRLPHESFGHAAGVVKGVLHVVGGAEEPRMHYAWIDRRWTKLPAPPMGVQYAEAVGIGSRLFVLGGVGTERLVMVYDTKTKKWLKAKDAPVPLAHFAAARHGNCIYAFGGPVGGQTHCFDFTKNQWK